jgi:HAD superfamily hydrolase (TIGR01549 family)
LQKYEAVLFDMDGVLVNSEPLYMKVNEMLFAEQGIQVPQELHMSFVGMAADSMWQKLKTQFTISMSVEALVEHDRRMQLEYFSQLTDIPVVPLVKEFLEVLALNKIPRAVASSSPRTMITFLLSKSCLSQYFPVTVSGQDVAHRKPSPEIFLLAAEKIMVKPELCIIIEDSVHGIAAAKAAGMFAVGYANPYSGSQNLEKADMVIADFSGENCQKILDLLL